MKEKVRIEQEVVDSYVFKPIYVTNFFDKSIYNYQEGIEDTDDERDIGQRLRFRCDEILKRIVAIQKELGTVDKGSEEYHRLSAELERKQQRRMALMDELSNHRPVAVPRQTMMMFAKMEGGVHKVRYKRYSTMKKRRKLVRVGFLR